MPQIDLAGEPLGYEGRGPAGGRDVLLVHGAGGDHRPWPAALAPRPRAPGAHAEVPAHFVAARRGELRVPAQVITGSADAMTPPKSAAIAGARLQLVDDAGHLPACDRPALLREALAGFLARPEA
ncbi:hypothetical protein EV699_11828 [Plasticicumulans lactativorans]|uniref:Uncharacterized protein n=1 Tax=Plasticicumulans lactativorans TaxID=1133106 RepID=A0A4R2L1Y9_9GAMM|nr:alpha/beta hydrolase [Plasticicumulans lactativorans]TCO79642.1 hypothetical protein EV699_11828 [Plasticicumulans lactativorans]